MPPSGCSTLHGVVFLESQLKKQQNKQTNKVFCKFFTLHALVTLYLNASLQTFITRFSYKQHFLSNARLKLAKNQANAMQHTEAELLLLENYSHSSCENNTTYSRK